MTPNRFQFGIDAPHIEGQLSIDDEEPEPRTKEERYPTKTTRRILTAKEVVKHRLTEGDH